MHDFFLEKNHVLRIQQSCVDHYGIEIGLKDEALLEDIISTAKPVGNDDPDTRTLAAIAAEYWVRMGRDKPFSDYNAELGLFCCEIFLSLNGLDLGLSDEEAQEISDSIEAGQIDAHYLERIILTTSRNLTNPGA